MQTIPLGVEVAEQALKLRFLKRKCVFKVTLYLALVTTVYTS